MPAEETVERVEIETRDVVRAHESIRDTFAGHRLVVRGSREGFVYRQTTAQAGDLAVDVLRHTMEVREDVDPIHDTWLAVVASGRFALAGAGDEVRSVAGDVLLFPQGTRFSAEWQVMGLRSVRIPTEQIARRSGVDPADFRLIGMSPISSALADYCRNTVRYLHSLFDGAEPAIRNRLVRASALDALATAVLTAFPGTHRERASGGRAQPAAVRRAVAHMDAHAADPLPLSEIAEASGIGPRALQEAFRRHRGTTPTAYLRRVRLERAHRELQAADPTRGDTVAAVAARWGFTHPGRFAAAYRAAYGRTPLKTLLD